MNDKMNPTGQSEADLRRTDAAWLKLQDRLAAEPAHPLWRTWPTAPTAEAAEAAEAAPQTAVPAVAGTPAMPAAAVRDGASDSRPRVRKRLLAGVRSKWAAGAAACLVLGAVIITPTGNRALASLLNQFRMQDVTVVSENDMRNLFYQLANGQSEESINKFGTFTRTQGKAQGNLTLQEVPQKLGISALPQKLTGQKSNQVSVSAASTLTVQLDIDQVNKAMKRIGATKLLPAAVDGKPITLSIPEQLYYNLSTDDEHWASLSQMKMPVVTVDPSIDINEALDALLNLPLLPGYLKESLQLSRMLSGSIPMPLITDDASETLQIAGTTVILETRPYNENVDYAATWVKDGQLFEFSGGSVYPDRAGFMDKLEELIGG